MQKITKSIRTAVVLFLALTAFNSKAQIWMSVNGGAGTACAGQISSAVTMTIGGATNYTWSIASFSTACAPSATSSTGGGTMFTFNACAGMYTICCYAMNGSSVITSQCQTLTVYPKPVVTVNGPGSTCPGNMVTLSASGAWTYTWSLGTTGANITVPAPGPNATNCYTVIGMSSLGCTASAVSCVSSMSLPAVSIAGNDTVCRGSSTKLTASGAVSYNWSTGATTSTIQVTPTVSTVYNVIGTALNGCTVLSTYTVVVDTTCSDVWPGDANSDGVVSNTDVLEIGLAFGNTGPARTPGGNAYISQRANNWTGMVSSGKNKCHADCNGDGTVDLNDTLAIDNNFGMTHSFKSSGSSAAGDINIKVPGNVATIGSWNYASIELGDASNQVSLYGVAFDLNFDESLIDLNSAYITYESSFLNASSQNVTFRKLDFTNGKIYGASVRVNGNNVSGSGQIAKFWFKLKTSVQPNTALNMSISNAQKVEKSGVISSLTGGSAVANAATVGINELNLFDNAISLYPNPASGKVNVQVQNSTASVNYSVRDISGREVLKGAFTRETSLDVSKLRSGSYIVQLQSGSLSSYKKLVVE